MSELMEKYTMEARAEGRVEGRTEERKSLIFNMLKNGMMPEAVSKTCDLPLDEVEEVQKELLQTV